MYRAISETEEQAVRDLYNSTADQLRVARPLDPAGWYKVKAYLRSQTEHAVPEDWTKEYAWLHATACANLAIDPLPPKSGLAKVVGPLLWWIGSPRDRHGRISEFLRGVVVLLVASLFGVATLVMAHLLGGAPATWHFVAGGIIGFVLLQFVISSDTHAGALSLFFLLTGAYSLVTGNWALSEWLRIALASLGVIFGAFMVSGWLL